MSDTSQPTEARTPGQMTYAEMRKLMLERQVQWGPYGLTEGDLAGCPPGIEMLVCKMSMQIEACMVRNDQVAAFVDKAVAATRRLADGMDALSARIPEKSPLILPGQ